MKRLIKDTAKKLFRIHPGLYDSAYMFYRRIDANRSAIPHDFKNKLQSLGADSLVIDLGANVGAISEMFAKTGARTIAFEPDPAALRLLRKTAARYPNMEIMEAAAGVKDRTAPIYRHALAGEHEYSKTVATSLAAGMPDVSSAPACEVREIDFARFLRELRSPVDILKMDIEGYEIELLNHLLEKSALQHVRIVLVEFHDGIMPAHKPQVAKLKTRLVKAFPDSEFHFDWV